MAGRVLLMAGLAASSARGAAESGNFEFSKLSGGQEQSLGKQLQANSVDESAVPEVLRDIQSLQLNGVAFTPALPTAVLTDIEGPKRVLQARELSQETTTTTTPWTVESLAEFYANWCLKTGADTYAGTSGTADGKIGGFTLEEVYDFYKSDSGGCASYCADSVRIDPDRPAGPANYLQACQTALDDITFQSFISTVAGWEVSTCNYYTGADKFDCQPGCVNALDLFNLYNMDSPLGQISQKNAVGNCSEYSGDNTTGRIGEIAWGLVDTGAESLVVSCFADAIGGTASTAEVKDKVANATNIETCESSCTGTLNIYKQYDPTGYGSNVPPSAEALRDICIAKVTEFINNTLAATTVQTTALRLGTTASAAANTKAVASSESTEDTSTSGTSGSTTSTGKVEADAQTQTTAAVIRSTGEVHATTNSGNGNANDDKSEADAASGLPSPNKVALALSLFGISLATT